MKNLSNLIIGIFVAVAFLSGCNEPSDPNLKVMATGSWNLVDLMMGEQVIADENGDFTLDLHQDGSCVFINHDGVGFTGSWMIDDEGTTLELTPDNEEVETVTFDVLYLRPDKMGIKRTVTSDMIGTNTFTYLLEK